MSRFAITSHAIERWAQLVDPVLGYDAAAAELRAGLAGRPERCGVTRRGQAVFRVEAPRLAYLVVKLGPDKLGKFYAGGGAAGVIVTVLPPEMWEGSERELVDEARELLEYRASIAVPAWQPPAAKPEIYQAWCREAERRGLAGDL